MKKMVVWVGHTYKILFINPEWENRMLQWILQIQGVKIQNGFYWLRIRMQWHAL